MTSEIHTVIVSGDNYIYVGTALGLRDCRQLLMKHFPEKAGEGDTRPHPANRLYSFFRRTRAKNADKSKELLPIQEV